MLYTNGNNEKAISTKYPEGLVYYDGEVIFGIGIFKKHVEAEEIYVHIISPKGNNWNVKVEKFIKLLFEIENPKIYGIYIRQIDEIQFDNIKAQYNEISTNPWDVLAPQEDETYNHCFITLDDIIEKRGNNIHVKTLSGKENHNHRKKARMAYNRFNNFLKRNNLNLIFEKYSVKKYTDAKYIVDTHFKSLKKRVGSTPEDYYNLIKYDKIRYGYIGYITGTNINQPIALFIGDEIDNNTIGLYATFTLRNQKFKETYDMTGFSAISQYCYIKIFEILLDKNIKYVNLGGSEIKDLNDFKKQLGAKEKKTHWLYKKNEN